MKGKLWIARTVGVILVITAGLKLWYLMTTPLGNLVHPDPVLTVFTHREALLLAVFLELFVAYQLSRSQEAWQAGAWLLYFSIAMTFYQVGLLLTCTNKCGCLGAASSLTGERSALWISRTLLLVFWLLSFFLLFRRHRNPNPMHKSQRNVRVGALGPLFLVSLFGIFSGLSARGGQTIHAIGHYCYTNYTGFTEAHDCEVRFDKKTLLLKEVPPLPSSVAQRYAIPAPCTNILYVTKEVLMRMNRCRNGIIVVGFDRPAYAWELGNCGATLQSCVFLALRCEELFPGLSGRRRLAPPWTATGHALSLILEAKYAWKNKSRPDQELTCTVVVSGKLKRTWRKSNLRSPVLTRHLDLMRKEEASIAPYRDGFTNGIIRFTRFTNVAGLNFPTHCEFTMFSPVPYKRAIRAGKSGKVWSKNTLLFDHIRTSSAPIQILPIEAKQIDVTEYRLFDFDLGIPEALYRTNRLASFEISPLARRNFELQREKVRKALQTQRIKKFLLTGFITVLLLGPAIIGFLQYKRNKRNPAVS